MRRVSLLRDTWRLIILRHTSSALWPTMTRRLVSYCPLCSRRPGNAGAKLPSTTGPYVNDP